MGQCVRRTRCLGPVMPVTRRRYRIFVARNACLPYACNEPVIKASRGGRMGIGKIGWTAAISISLAGCAGVGTPSPVQQPAVQSEARWVETRPDVRTLIVRPDRVGEV